MPHDWSIEHVVNGEPKWRWKHYVRHILVAESDEFHSMGAAVLDAEKHGFDPVHQRWELVTVQRSKKQESH